RHEWPLATRKAGVTAFPRLRLDGLGPRIVRIRRRQGRLTSVARRRVALADAVRVERAPQLEATIQAIDLGKALIGEVGRGVLAGVAVVAGDDQRGVEIGGGDEVRQRLVVEVAGAVDVRQGEAVRVAHVDQRGAPVEQLAGLFRTD